MRWRCAAVSVAGWKLIRRKLFFFLFFFPLSKATRSSFGFTFQISRFQRDLRHWGCDSEPMTRYRVSSIVGERGKEREKIKHLSSCEGNREFRRVEVSSGLWIWNSAVMLLLSLFIRSDRATRFPSDGFFKEKLNFWYTKWSESYFRAPKILLFFMLKANLFSGFELKIWNVVYLVEFT